MQLIMLIWCSFHNLIYKWKTFRLNWAKWKGTEFDSRRKITLMKRLRSIYRATRCLLATWWCMLEQKHHQFKSAGMFDEKFSMKICVNCEMNIKKGWQQATIVGRAIQWWFHDVIISFRPKETKKRFKNIKFIENITKYS